MRVEKEYEEFLTRWLKAKKEHPGIDHGPEPSPEQFGFNTNETDVWMARKIKAWVKREIERSA